MGNAMTSEKTPRMAAALRSAPTLREKQRIDQIAALPAEAGSKWIRGAINSDDECEASCSSVRAGEDAVRVLAPFFPVLTYNQTERMLVAEGSVGTSLKLWPVRALS